ncbi:hypothetical protein BaRGS_00030372 [Batillaria attramentaria]|uniref:Uncharacterized protein n=1 Tax=Batillaria attramentaria TaxID=370345 RepID=A0ABD0JTX9_9CAEN
MTTTMTMNLYYYVSGPFDYPPISTPDTNDHMGLAGTFVLQPISTSDTTCDDHGDLGLCVYCPNTLHRLSLFLVSVRPIRSDVRALRHCLRIGSRDPDNYESHKDDVLFSRGGFSAPDVTVSLALWPVPAGCKISQQSRSMKSEQPKIYACGFIVVYCLCC